MHWSAGGSATRWSKVAPWSVESATMSDGTAPARPIGCIARPRCTVGAVTVDFGDQQPESREVQSFTCGHEVEGGRLRTADADGLDVERRESEDTVMPVDPEE